MQKKHPFKRITPEEAIEMVLAGLPQNFKNTLKPLK